eukprot:4165948-Pleurochrysis_carterae.AAC.1
MPSAPPTPEIQHTENQLPTRELFRLHTEPDNSELIRTLANDRSSLALQPPAGTLSGMCQQLLDPTDATALRSLKGQVSAWRHWRA